MHCHSSSISRCQFDPLQLWAPLSPVWVEPPPDPGGPGHGIQACRAPGRQGRPLTPHLPLRLRWKDLGGGCLQEGMGTNERRCSVSEMESSSGIYRPL